MLVWLDGHYLTSSLALQRLRTGKSPHSTLPQKHAKQLCTSMHKSSQKQPKAAKSSHNKTPVPFFKSRVFNLTVSNEYRHEVGAAGASPLTSRPSSSSRRGQRRLTASAGIIVAAAAMPNDGVALLCFAFLSFMFLTVCRVPSNLCIFYTHRLSNGLLSSPQFFISRVVSLLYKHGTRMVYDTILCYY